MTVQQRRMVSMGLSVACHAAMIAVIAYVPPVRRAIAPGDEQPVVAIMFVPAPAEPSAADLLIEEQEAAEASAPPEGVQLPGFEFDAARVRARQESLFPFLTHELRMLDDARAAVAAQAAKLTWASRTPPPRQSGLPPLAVSDAEFSSIVNRAWSRRERWSSFLEIATLAATHDPDDGRAGELLRVHLDQNLLQPYFDADTRDPRFWVMLTLASDHEPLIRFVERFVRQHPSSRASTELLFLLDEFAQASRDALLMLMSTSPERDLTLTRAADAGAYELARAIRQRYGDWLTARQLRRTTDITGFYDAVRLRILSTIIATTPDSYGAADARFLAGRILWEQNNVPEAMSWWRQITPDDRNMYAEAYGEILPEVRSPRPSSASAINRALGAEYRRWLEFSERRLREFGYRFNSF